MKLKNKHFSIIRGLLFTITFCILAALVAGALRTPFDARSFSTPAEALTGFTYEIAGGGRGAATFPHSFKNLAPNTVVTIYVDIEPRRYDNLLVKTVYTPLRIYADDELIYECGQAGSYPAWLLDPPTLLKIVPLPESASNLRFEYVSPSQRGVMSVPALMAGSDGALLAELFNTNGALLVMSLFFLFLGLAVSVVSLLFWRKGKIFLYLGLFSFAVGCWSFGECNATMFLIPSPVLLYLMTFGGLFTLVIPFLRYGCLILNPRNVVLIRIAAAVTEVAVIIAFALQLMGVAALSKSMYVFHILIPLDFVIFAATTVWEYFRYRNKTAKRFLLPTLVLAVSAILEVVNYSLRFTSVLSLFFLSGAFIFTLLLGFIGGQYIFETRREMEELAAQTSFFRKMNHALRTPLTVVSTNIQTARRRPEEADELLTESQSEIMKMAEMIDDALQDSDKEEARR